MCIKTTVAIHNRTWLKLTTSISNLSLMLPFVLDVHRAIHVLRRPSHSLTQLASGAVTALQHTAAPELQLTRRVRALPKMADK